MDEWIIIEITTLRQKQNGFSSSTKSLLFSLWGNEIKFWEWKKLSSPTSVIYQMRNEEEEQEEEAHKKFTRDRVMTYFLFYQTTPCIRMFLRKFSHKLYYHSIEKNGKVIERKNKLDKNFFPRTNFNIIFSSSSHLWKW